MNYELLADVAQVIMGQSPPSSTYNTVGEGLPFYQGKTDFGDMHPTPRVYCTEPSRIAEAGDILISVRAPVGPTNISRERSAIGRGLSVIRAGEKIDRDFLLYFLRFYEPELAKAGTGSTFAAISREDLEAIKIPLPPPTEQKRIASLLARADRLRQLRRTAHDLGDASLQSVFLEMFGKVRGKTKEVFLGEIADIASGVTKGQNYNGRNTVEVPYLRVANVQDGYLDLSVIKTIQALPSEVEELRLKPGDVVMTEGGDFDKLGRGAIWRGEIENCIHQNHIFRVRLDTSKVKPEFFENYLLSPKAKDYFLMASKQTTNLASINMTQLKQLPVSLYPLSLQEEFADVVVRVESLRGRMGEPTRGWRGCLRVCWRRVLDEDRPRIFHECSNVGALFVHSWFYSWMVSCFAGVAARASCRVHRDIESLPVPRSLGTGEDDRGGARRLRLAGRGVV
ncbi:MAG: restriction endonuclease subunit S [Chloroflexi bacterium]|nr:restriction endonuclease subunit S [Chloroflexota bacterium]